MTLADRSIYKLELTSQTRARLEKVRERLGRRSSAEVVRELIDAKWREVTGND